MSTRLWFAREAQFTADPKIQMLGHEFGPGGALVIEEVFAIAKLNADNGKATILYAQLAGRAFVSPSKARQIILRAADLGVLEFDGAPGPKGCSIDLPRWSRWQVKDATAAARQARKREHGTAKSHAADRDIARDFRVTVTPPTETETETAGSSPAVGGRASAAERATPLSIDEERQALADHIVGILQRGVDGLATDEGCKKPSRAAVLSVLADAPRDTAIAAAIDARSIAQAQNRAPNIVALFAQRLSSKEAA